MSIKKEEQKETKQPVKKEKQRGAKRSSITKYKATRISLSHPYQGIFMPVGFPVVVVEDSWLISQIKAGLVEKC